MNLLRCHCLALLLASLPYGIAETNSLNDASVVAESQAVESSDIIDAPAYDKLVPVIGWNRYSGDTATSIREWMRCWKYLNLKKPKTFIMKWLNGLNIRIYPGNEVFRALFVRGIYDPNLVVVINSLLSKNGVFIDIGANMGYCSMLMSKTIGEDGRVLAIEPSQRDFLRLVDNVNLNKLNNVNVYRLAISDVNDKVKISIATEERSALNTLGTEFSNKGIEKEAIEEVNAVTLDSFITQENLDRIDVIKLDIEGSEFKALKGAQNTIEKYRPALIVGVNKNTLAANGSSVEEVEQTIKGLRYKMYYISESPTFTLKEVDSLKQVNVNRIICVHESFTPPALPKTEEVTFVDKFCNFFRVN